MFEVMILMMWGFEKRVGVFEAVVGTRGGGCGEGWVGVVVVGWWGRGGGGGGVVVGVWGGRVEEKREYNGRAFESFCTKINNFN